MVHKQVRMGPEFLRTLWKLCVLLCCQASHTNKTQTNYAKRKKVNGNDASQIRWRRIVNVNATTEIRSMVSRGPKHFTLAMAQHWAAFNGNTTLITTFSSFNSFSKLICNFMLTSPL